MNPRATGLTAAALFLATSGLVPGFPVSSVAWAQTDSARPPAGGINATPIGKVMSATGIVHIEHASAVVVQANVPANGAGQSKAGDPVYRGDLIQTGSDGTINIAFTDGTSFNVSSNARMEVNEFVYDPNGHANSTLLSLTKGTFTFIAGNVAKTGGMKVDTPLGTMGIRGTAPRVEILSDGSVKFSTLVEQK